MKAATSSSVPCANPNETYTYIAIPVEALQQVSGLNQLLTVAQNVILKAQPDGTISQETQPGQENFILRAISANKQDNVFTGGNSNIITILEDDKLNFMFQNSLRPTVIEQSGGHATDSSKKLMVPKPRIDDHNITVNKSGVRYLKGKWSPNIPFAMKKMQLCSFKCPLCNEVLNKIGHYRKHMKAHRNAKKYKCEQCSASYNVKDNLKLHMAMHTKSKPICPLCNRQFQRLASLKAHIFVHQVEEVFTCVDCMDEFDHEDEYEEHIRSHGKEENKKNNEQYPYECCFCSHFFEDVKKYKEHVSFHLKLKRLIMNRNSKKKVVQNRKHLYKCNVCKKSFPKYCLLERHTRIHSGEKPFACHICHKAFNQKGTLQIHLARHAGLKPFQCSLCPASFCQKGNLRVHVQKTHVAPPPGESSFKCTMCTCIFKKISSLNTHITKAHAVGKNDNNDGDILEVIEQLKELEKRLDTRYTGQNSAEFNVDNVAPNIETPMPTNILENFSEISRKSDENKVKLVKLTDSSVEGVIRKHVVKQKTVLGHATWYICPTCSKEFKKPSDLIRHIRTHTKEKPFKCRHCNRAFSLKSTLTTHMHTHFTTRKYQCYQCLKYFATTRSLNVHLRKHNQNFACTSCGMTFDSIEKAKAHTEVHKVEVPNLQMIMQKPMVETSSGLLTVDELKSLNTIPKKRPHRCHFCKASFIKSVHLKRHILTHTGERNFKCNVCSKSFYSASALKEHQQFHSGQKNYSCNVCAKRFATSSILKRHTTIHNTTAPFICPYCRKHFKSVILCRKHIQVHKKNFAIQIQAMNLTGEIDIPAHLENSVEKTTTLEAYPASSLLEDGSLNIPLTSLTEVDEIPSFKPVNDSTVLSHSRDAAKILYTDGNGIIITTNADIDNIQKETDLETFDHQFCETPTIPPTLVDKNAMALLPERAVSADDLLNVNTAVDNQEDLVDEATGATVFINYDDLQALTASNVNACLTQLKINDPLLIGGLNDTQDHNILFSAGSSLNQAVDLQLDPHDLEMLMPTFTLYNNVSVPSNSLNNLSASFPNIILPNMEENADSHQILSNLNDLSKKNDLFSKPLEEIDLNVEPADGEGSILSSLLYNAALQLGVNPNVVSNKVAEVSQPAAQVDTQLVPETSQLAKGLEIGCSHCGKKCTQFSELKNHKCLKRTSSRRTGGTSLLKPQFANKTKLTTDKAEEEKIEKTAKNVSSKNNQKSKANQYVCPYCGKPFKKPSDLQRHIRVHTGEKPFGCVKCGKNFSLKSTLESHMRTHAPGGNKDFNCVVCSSYFSSKSSLRVHMMMHTGIKPYQCLMCPEKFRTVGHRQSHMAAHLKRSAKKPNTTSSKSSRMKNILSALTLDEQLQQNPALLVTEPLPEPTVTTETALLQEKDLYPSQAIPMDSLLQQLQLNNVLLQDSDDLSFVQVDINNDGQITGVKPLTASAEEIQNMNAQFETTVDELLTTPQKHFLCTICGKYYSSYKALIKHRRQMHSDETFRCTKCDMLFDSGEELENHMKQHPGNHHPYYCQFCANTFGQLKNLKTHLRRIHDVQYISS